MCQPTKRLGADVTQPDVLMTIDSRVQLRFGVIAMDQFYSIESK